MKSKIIIIIAVIYLVSCRKDKKPDNQISSSELNALVLNDLGNNVYLNAYYNLSLSANNLDLAIRNFASNQTNDNLLNARNAWRSARQIWEKSEAHLFGPVSTNDIDPRIDAWPVDFIRLDSVMNSNAALTEQFVDGLEESLKGFHPIEYLLFGVNSGKTVQDFNQRQLDYLQALSLNLMVLTNSLYLDWHHQHGNFLKTFVNANNQVFADKKAAFEEIANALIGICDEVASGKMEEVLITLDTTLEESPFANNSITDFKNNLIGVQESYLGINGNNNGKGLEDFVRKYNLSLDASIKQKLASAIASFDNITVPFSEAIFSQPLQVQNTIDQINALKQELEDNLIPLIRIYAN